MNYSKGITWFDDCRIPFVDEGDIKSATPGSLNATGEHSIFGIKNDRAFLNTQGRFPANLLVSDDMLNDGSITSKGKMKLHRMIGWGENIQIKKNDVEYQGDKGSNSRYYDIDAWFNNLINEL